ncbi:sushi, von Willebrand factor type A, EGF and pentraxin domain-containing protein 1 [Trichonephila clavipes]|nr:sushi, von Willebrand factor type A, EGF and pentraxin domain-containing protein 1 [Trichonephila clavipes]
MLLQSANSQPGLVRRTVELLKNSITMLITEQHKRMEVQCPNGIIAAEKILCLPTNEWSPLPVCNYRSQCAHQQLPVQVRFINNKCKQSTAPRCKVGCDVRVSSSASNFNIRGLLFVTDAECNSSGLWHGLPNCEQAKEILSKKIAEKLQCPKPKLPKHSVLVRKCSPAEGSVCHYECKKGFFSTGKNTMRCFMKRWIRESICKPILCPPLPKTFHHDITCRRTIGSNCDLQCKVGTLDGNSTVTCYVSGKWSKFPTCSSSFKNCTRKISPYISFVQDCSFQDDAKCQIRCPENFALVGRNFIKCEKGTWKNIPQCIPEKISPYKLLKIKCSFPPPLHANLKLIRSCNPEGGITCDITCRDDSAYMTGPNSTTCLPPGIWSKMKPCSGGRSYCSVPKFRKHLKVSQNCSGKEVGSKCYVNCKYRSEIGKLILCKKNLKWSSPPRCSCPLPILREDINFRENCTDRNPEEKCALECKKGLLMIGDANIRCKYKLKWSSLPSCKRPKCLKPKLSRVLSFKEDCTSKLSGERCKLECKEGGRMLKHSTIQCISGTHWTEQPKCACPFPFLSKGVIAKNDCRKVFPGQKCFLSCKNNSFKISNDFITCNSYTTWSGTSDCKRKRCPRPIITNTLLFEEDCSVKGFGDRCHVSCKELGTPFKFNYTVCLNTMLWTPLPICSCPLPSLPDFIETRSDCKNKLPGQHCSLVCKGDMKIEGNAAIICKKNTKWSKLPNCKRNNCFKKKLPDILLYSEDCKTVTPGKKCLLECKEGGEFFGSNFIICLFGFLWTPLPTCSCPIPNLPDYLIAIENCNKKGIGQKCHLKCKEYMPLAPDKFILCQNNTRWSHVPKCKKFPCLELRLPKHLGFKGDCVSKYPGESCQIMCKTGGTIIGSHRVTCIKGKKWTKLPHCTCPSPKLRNQFILIEKCSNKLIGQRCRLKCKFDQTLSNVKHIFCKNNAQWSPLPKCKPRHCTLPKLPKTLVYAGDCSSLAPGKPCFVQCKGGGKLIGSNKISCNKIKEQRIFPRCTCPLPLFTKDLTATEKCIYKTEGEKCHVTCRKPFLLVGKGFIVCKEDTRWSPSPQCVKLTCPKLKLSSTLKFRENCSSKFLGEKCRLQCREGDDLKAIVDCSKKKSGEVCFLKCSTKRTFISGNNFIWCQANTKWSVLPKCMRVMCSQPKLPRNLMFIKDCSSRPVGKDCTLGCRNGGKPFPRNYISCITAGYWSRLPSCSCPTPMLKNNLKFKNSECNKILPGKLCVLQCKPDSYIVGRNYIVCRSNSKWSIQPVCKTHVCKKPHLPPFLKLEESCLFKRIRESCKISCREGGNVIGENKVTCLAKEKWNISNECTCPSPIVSEKLQTKKYCNNTQRGEYCEVFCKNRNKSEKNIFIICQNNTKWSAPPKCVQFCPDPMLPQILVLEEDCVFKSVKESCKIRCKQGGLIIGKPFIECKKNLNWSTFPNCTCPQPVLSDHVKEMENCSKKMPKETCKIKCKPGWTFRGKNFLVCENNTKWSVEPKCILKNCSKPALPDILEFGENCTLKYTEEKCHVTCKENRRIIGKNYIVCKFNGSWTPLPYCLCPLSKLESRLRYKGNCGFQTPGQKCSLECEMGLKLKGPSFILCQNNSKWSSQPKCVKRICPNVVLQDDLLEIKEECSTKTIGDVCQVACKNGGKLIGGKAMECLKDFQWSSPPDCSCENPNVSEPIELITKCDAIPKMGKCFVRCKSGYDMEGINYTTCQNNGKWGAFPACQKVSCPEPALSSSILKVNGECSGKFYQDACFVTCREGGQLIGEAKIKCEDTGVWSSLPLCTCPVPNSSGDLVLKKL